MTQMDVPQKALELSAKLRFLASEHRRIGTTKGQLEKHELYASQLEETIELLGVLRDLWNSVLMKG